MALRRTSCTRLLSNSAVRRDQGKVRSVKMRSASFQRGSSFVTSTERSCSTSLSCFRANFWASRLMEMACTPAFLAWFARNPQVAKALIRQSAPTAMALQPSAWCFCLQIVGCGARLSLRTGMGIRGPHSRGSRAGSYGGEWMSVGNLARPRPRSPGEICFPVAKRQRRGECAH